MNIHLIDGSAAERQASEKVVDCFLVAAEKKSGKGLRALLDLGNGFIEIVKC